MFQEGKYRVKRTSALRKLHVTDTASEAGRQAKAKTKTCPAQG